jgi:hypothetical protein
MEVNDKNTPAPQTHVDAEDIREQKLATIVAPDNGTPQEVLSAVLECAKAWVPEARIVGNVRAGDIVRAIEALPAPEITYGEGKLHERSRGGVCHDHELERLSPSIADECRDGCQYSKDVGMQEYSCASRCQYLDKPPAPQSREAVE